MQAESSRWMFPKEHHQSCSFGATFIWKCVRGAQVKTAGESPSVDSLPLSTQSAFPAGTWEHYYHNFQEILSPLIAGILPGQPGKKLHLFLRSCRAALRWLFITVKGLFCSHCSGRGSSILCILGLENPLLTGECLVQLDKHRCFPEIPKHCRVQRLTFFTSTMLISAVQRVRACLQQDQLCLDVIENYGHLCNSSLPLN